MEELLKHTENIDEHSEALQGEDVRGGELNDIDAIARMFQDADDIELGHDDADPAEAGKATEAGDDGEVTGDTDAVEVSLPLPGGMDAALWEKMAPEVRQAVHEREKAHAEELGRERQNAAALRENREQFAVRANAALQQALGTMRAVVEGEYAGVNWQQLAQTDPATYVQLQQSMLQRVKAVQQIQQQIKQQVQAYEQQRTKEENQVMQREFAVVAPEIKAMFGDGFDGKQFAADVAGYMREQGCPPEVVNGLRKGYELKLITKAMLYDRLMTQRAAAAQKVASAPKVQAPRGAVPVDTGRVAKARALLNKDPNSTDALAALFEAM